MSKFIDQLENRVLFLDGAMGTSIHNHDLDLAKDYLDKENYTEILVRTRPEVIQQIHESFLAVGADAVETDTFGANKLVFAEFDLVEQTRELNKVAAEIAHAACENHSTKDKPRFVVGSIGPGTKLVTLGNTDWDTMHASYLEQCRGLLDGGIDVFLIETAQDILQVKCAINACLEALKEINKTVADVPIMVQVTIEQFGTTLIGTDIAGVAAALRDLPILSLGMNCATGPAEMAEHVHYLAKHWPGKLSLLPNAGLPSLVDGRTEYPLGPEPFARKVAEYVESCGINLVGGCCGTTPEHIANLVEMVGDRAPAKVVKEPWKPAISSLMGAVEYRQDLSILNIGERTNASGSRKFKRLLEEENFDEIMSLARDMVREGSHVIDVNVDYAGRDNRKDMDRVVGLLVQQVNAPLMLDSTQPATIEAGLKRAGGKCIINSANLEDGEEKFALMCGLAKKYGAGLVLGTIDEDPEEAMARTADRKLSIAQRMYKLATEQHGLAPGDLVFDPLVLPISTGMDKDRRSALETIEGTRRIAEAFPECQITCGLSNVSFGLNPAARQVLNSVFLHELVQAGLTSAILHVSKILPKTRIEDAQWDAAVELIYNRCPQEAVTLADGTETTDPLQIFIDLFPDGAEAKSAKQDITDLPLEERLQKHIIDGEKKALTDTLDEAMKKYPPLDIVNDHLLAGMKVVGELFGSGQMQLPFVLQSAEVMKMAVAHLEPHMEKADSGGKGSIVLATVKGDVHDIGKNLVDIILTNNGYTVHNLGIKQPINNIVAKWKETRADAIGLSGLLVKSVMVMEENLRELNDQSIGVPILLGGAALSKHYCDSHLREVYEGSVYHGKDAFEGLRIMDLLKSGKSDDLDAEIEARLSKRADSEREAEASRAKKQAGSASAGGDSSSGSPASATAVLPTASPAPNIPTAPFFGSRVIDRIDLDQVYPFINKVALFRGQWQLKKGKKTDAQYQQQLEDEIEPLFNQLKKQLKDDRILEPRVVYGYYPCNSDGDNLVV